MSVNCVISLPDAELFSLQQEREVTGQRSLHFCSF